MSPEELSSTVLDAPPSQAELALKLESLRRECELDVMYCTTRDQHIRAVTRLAQVVHIIEMFG